MFETFLTVGGTWIAINVDSIESLEDDNDGTVLICYGDSSSILVPGTIKGIMEMVNAKLREAYFPGVERDFDVDFAAHDDGVRTMTPKKVAAVREKERAVILGDETKQDFYAALYGKKDCCNDPHGCSHPLKGPTGDQGPAGPSGDVNVKIAIDDAFYDMPSTAKKILEAVRREMHRGYSPN